MATQSQVTSHSTTNYSGICQRCAKIDLKRVLSKVWRPDPESTAPGSNHHPILNIDGHEADTWTTSCILCGLLRAIAPPKELEGMDGVPWWRERQVSLYGPDHAVVGAIQSDNNFLGVENVHDSNSRFMYYPIPDAYLCVQNDSAPTVRILDPKKADLGTLQSWVTTCFDLHGISCRGTESDEVPGFRLLDVRVPHGTRSLHNVGGKAPPYVALSYVWSQAPSRGDDIPVLIEDAIEVTKSLGFDYIWIDRYCIPQAVGEGQDEQERKKQEQEKQEQIKRMAQIYGNAELTIIAAPGDSQEHGLPGISAPRKPQPHAKIGEYTLVSTLTTPRVLVHASRWNSRAWTYQEALCSRRRLIFTDEQVFWECEQTSCRETVDYEWPLHKYNIFNSYPVHGLAAKTIREVAEYISTYTKRQLTLDDDALNGMLGILRIFQEGAAPVYHIWGLPMTTEHEFLASMNWALKTPGRRRPGFPTWSWTAWVSEVVWRHLQYSDFQPAKDCRVSMGQESGSFLPFQHIFEHYVKCSLNDRISNYLHIEGWMVDLHAKIFDPDSALFAWPASTGEDLHAIVPVLLTEEVDEKTRDTWRQVPRDLLGLILADHLNLDRRQPLFVLVLAKVDSHYERIGHVELDNRPGFHTDGTKSWSISTGRLPILPQVVDGEVLDSHYELCRRGVATWMRNVTFRHITLA